MAIIATEYLVNFPHFEDSPILYFLGDEKPGRHGGTYWTFHRANQKCLRKMMEVAKFKKVEEISTYLLVSEDGQYKIPSVVFHCWV